MGRVAGSPRSPRREPRGKHTKHPLWRNLLAVGLSGIGVGLLGIGAAIGAPLDSATTLTGLQALIGIGLHFSVGALAWGAVVERRRTGRFLPAKKVQVRTVAIEYRTAAIVIAALLTLLVGGFWYWVVAASQPSILLAFSLAAPCVLVAGGLYAVRQVTLGRPQRVRAFIDRQFAPAAAFGGAVVGLILAVVALAASAIADTAAQGDAPAVLAIPNPGVYVALGDSYSAGEGLPRDVPSPGNCHRSDKAYSWLLAKAGKWPNPIFEACSGAVMQDVFNNSDNGGPVPAQVSGVPNPSAVKLITLTMGGNDSLFSKVVGTCIAHPSCMWGDFPPRGTKEYDYLGHGPLEHDWALKTIIGIGNADQRLLTSLKSHFPNARIVMIGYPYLFPDGPAPLFPDLMCASVLRRVDQPDRAEIRVLQDQFNNVLYEEAAKAGVDYVSPKAIWDGHEPCGHEGAWTNTIQAYLNFANPIGGGSFHPTAAGQQALAALLSCYLTDNPTPPRPRPSIQMPSDWFQPPDAVGLPIPWGSTGSSFVGCGPRFH